MKPIIHEITTGHTPESLVEQLDGRRDFRLNGIAAAVTFCSFDESHGRHPKRVEHGQWLREGVMTV